MSRSWISGHTTHGFRRAGAALAITAAVLGSAACGSDSDADAAVASDTAADAPAAVTRHYVVFPDGVPDKGWKKVEAVRLTGEGRKAQGESDKHLDWFAEYLGPGKDLGDQPHLGLSGYRESLAEFRRDHPVPKSTEVKSGKILGHRAIWGNEAGIGRRFVLIAIADDYTIELTAGGITLAELRRLAATLEETDQAGWKDAGGVVVDCLPDEDCPGVDHPM